MSHRCSIYLCFGLLGLLMGCSNHQYEVTFFISSHFGLESILSHDTSVASACFLGLCFSPSSYSWVVLVFKMEDVSCRQQMEMSVLKSQSACLCRLVGELKSRSMLLLLKAMHSFLSVFFLKYLRFSCVCCSETGLAFLGPYGCSLFIV